MTTKRALDIANGLIDDRIELFGYENTIIYLLDVGVTEEELINDFHFEQDGDFYAIVAQYKEENK